MDVYSILLQLSATTKKNEKLSILENHKTNALLKKVLKFALCPHIRFNIKKIPTYSVGATANATLTLDEALDAFKTNLIDRGITGSIAKSDFLVKILESVTSRDAEVLCRIIKKDLRAGVAEGLVDKVFPGLIPPWPCLLAESYNEKNIKRITYPAFCQLKSDGTRINIVVKDNTVSYFGRSGKEFDFLGIPDFEFIELAKVINSPSGIVFDGEALVLAINNHGILKRETGNGIISRALKGSMTIEEASSVVFDVWDLIPYDDFISAKHSELYQTRYNALDTALSSTKLNKIRLIETSIVRSFSEAQIIYEKYLAAGYEGAVLKNFNTVWEHKRSKDQVKLKAENECEVLVVGINPGNGKYEGLIGSLSCTTADGVLVDVSGFDDEFRKLTAAEIVGKIITVRYNTVTEDSKTKVKSLFLPRFVELRHDKTEPDSIL